MKMRQYLLLELNLKKKEEDKDQLISDICALGNAVKRSAVAETLTEVRTFIADEQKY